MKKYLCNYKLIFGVAAIGIIFSWICFPCLVEFTSNHDPKINSTDKFNAIYVAAGALFAAFSCWASLFLFYKQRKDLIGKTSIELFINIMDKIKNDPLFIQSRNYILSNQFNEDYASLKQYKGTDNVTIDDFNGWRNDIVILEDKENRLRSPYECIRYFCDKMDFIGIIIEQQYIDTTIFDYFGGEVIASYAKLEPLLLETRKDPNKAGRFIHYTYLTNEALNKREDARKQLHKMNKKFRRDKRKRVKTTNSLSIM